MYMIDVINVLCPPFYLRLRMVMSFDNLCNKKMSILLPECDELLSIEINYISEEDFYNSLYWDHRIYDVRSLDDYNRSHVCRSHNINILSIDSILNIDQEINNNYGKAENPSKVVLYHNDKTNDNYQLEMKILNLFITYLKSSKNVSKKWLKEICILIDGYQSFYLKFSFLCSDYISYKECLQLSWPSLITPSIYLGSSICRNETIISLLKITHLISFSDYPQRQIQLSDIKTFHYEISDSLSSNILSIFPSCIKLISKAINDDKGTVLIHCEQGVSRSPIVVMAYLLYSNKNFLTVDQVYNFVKSKRDIIKPNQSFIEQLKQYFINIRMINVLE